MRIRVHRLKRCSVRLLNVVADTLESIRPKKNEKVF